MTDETTTTKPKMGRPPLSVPPERVEKIQARAADLEKAEAAYKQAEADFHAEVIAALEEDRSSVREVAKTVGRSVRTIQSWWSRHRAEQVED